MSTWIALIRGINVGGKNVVRMADLKLAIESNPEVGSVQHYIQSGNLIIKSKIRSRQRISELLRETLYEEFQVTTSVQIFTLSSFRVTVSENPFASDSENDKNIHIVFLSQPTQKLNTESIEHLATNGEEYKLTNKAFYFYAPNGVGRSKLFSRIEKLLAVPVTARNLRTVKKLLALAED